MSLHYPALHTRRFIPGAYMQSLLEQQHSHASVGTQRIARGVGRIERDAGTADKRNRADHPGIQQVTDNLGAFAIDFRIDLVDESAVTVRIVDANIMRGRTDPDRLPLESARPAED